MWIQYFPWHKNVLDIVICLTHCILDICLPNMQNIGICAPFRPLFNIYSKHLLWSINNPFKTIILQNLNLYCMKNKKVQIWNSLLAPFSWVYFPNHKRQRKFINILQEALCPINSKKKKWLKIKIYKYIVLSC